MAKIEVLKYHSLWGKLNFFVLLSGGSILHSKSGRLMAARGYPLLTDRILFESDPVNLDLKNTTRQELNLRMEVKKYVTMIFLFKKVRFWKIGMFKIKSFVVDQIVFYTDMGWGGTGHFPTFSSRFLVPTV